VAKTVDDTTLEDSDAVKLAQMKRRKHGVVGKLHNMVVYLRVLPQCRTVFKICRRKDMKEMVSSTL
jgi:hypothetical protein